MAGPRVTARIFALCAASAAALGAARPARAQLVGFWASLVLPGGNVVVTSFSGLGSQNDVVVQTSTGPNGLGATVKLPGKLTVLDLTVQRGITTDRTLASWRDQVVAGNLAQARQNVSFLLFDSGFKPIAQWDLTNCWPSAISNAPNADGSRVLENLTLACEGIKRSL